MKQLVFVIIVLVFISCNFNHKKAEVENFYNIVENSENVDVNLVFNYDFRIKEMNEFKDNILKYLDELQISHNCLTIDMNTGKAYYNGIYKEFSKSYLFDEEYSYYFYDKEGKLIFKGSMSGNEDRLLYRINLACKLIKTYSVYEELKIGDNVKYLPFLYKTLKGNFEKNFYTCFVIYDNICYECNSGKVLKLFDEFASIYYWVNFKYITVHNYSQEEINRFKSGGDINIDILSAESNLVKKYFDTAPRVKDDFDHFKGLILILNKEGKIEMASHKLEDVLVKIRLLFNREKE